MPYNTRSNAGSEALSPRDGYFALPTGAGDRFVTGRVGTYRAHDDRGAEVYCMQKETVATLLEFRPIPLVATYGSFGMFSCNFHDRA